MVVAGSLSPQTRNSNAVAPPTRLEQLVARAVADRVPLPTIANRLARKTGKPAKYWRQRLRRVVAHSSYVRDEAFTATNAELIMALPASGEAIGRRAGRGRPDAAKLMWSATGYHNDRVQHEHSGGIDIRLSIPRPETTQDQLGPGKDPESSEYVDADVVEEDET
jgi:hypothetical protein